MRPRWDWTVLAGWVLALVLVRAARFTERDPYWQARDGSERWAGAPLARPDSWSWAPTGGLFRPTSPAWNTALGLGHEWIGPAGVAVAGAMGMLAYFVLAVVVARRLGARPLPTVLATAAIAALALPMISPRATIVIQALLLATIALGHTVMTRPLPRSWWAMAGVVLVFAALGWVGAWLHVSWSVMACGLAGALTLMASLAGVPGRRIVLVAVAGVALGVGSMLGPYGWSVWRLLADISSASDGQIVEWLSPFTSGLRARWLPVAAVCLALALTCAAHLARNRRGAPGSRERAQWALEGVLVATGLAATLAGLVAIRFLGVAALTLLPVLAAELSAATVRWRSTPTRSTFLRTRLTARYWRPILTAVLVLLLPAAVVAALDPGRPRPEAEIAGSLPRDCRLFTDPDTAGAVLLLRPDVTVWIDMRTEVYGARAYADMRRRMTSGDGVDVPTGATCLLLPMALTPQIDDQDDLAWDRRADEGGLALWLPDESRAR